MNVRHHTRCRERLAALATATLDADTARRSAIEELRRAVGFDRWCWPVTDPDSGLAMSGIGEFNFWPSLPRIVALEEHGDIVSKPSLIVGPRATMALSEATRGDLARSVRWRECLQPYGIGDELMTACRDSHGCWGSVELMRDSGDRPFSEDESRLLEEVAPTLGAIVRRSVGRSVTSDGADAAHRAPGTLILNGELTPSSWTAPVRDWLADLPRVGEMLPAGIYEVGARVLGRGDLHGLPTRLRLRTHSAGWAVVEGARLEGDADGVAITIRAAAGDEVLDLLCKAHELTARERQLVERIRTGESTGPVARALGISPYTVQDHLKSIFDKTGVRSRRELLSLMAGHVRRRGDEKPKTNGHRSRTSV